MQDFLAMEMENKILMYVDDVLLYITNPDLLDTFGTYADYTVNIQKTQVIMFYYNPSPELRIPSDWSQKATKYVGVWLPHCHKDLYKKNY